ncbi:roadblock/LC7 domain-containing protein [Actinoplanes sp. NPDC026619]|uniref:roadblock/LC7 domain-containing protein n=1 Tax=Actinoplanes sp. NPDC026619 TaxID=3155798 RepID=UPI0034013F01
MIDRFLAMTDVGPLLDELAAALPGTEAVVLLSTDGLELSMAAVTDPAAATNLAAVAAGLHAVAEAANRNNGGRRVDQCLVETDYRMLVVLPVAPGALLSVLFDAVSDLAGTREKIAWFADRLSIRLTNADLVQTP